MAVSSNKILDWMILLGRIFLGVTYLLSGLNWFFGFLPVPSMHGAGMPIKHQVIAEMINTGWMFQLTKVLEIAAGLALLSNRFVPLALAATAPIAVMTFLLDAFILNAFVQFFSGEASWKFLATEVLDMIFGGACVLIIHAFLVFAFWDYFRPLLAWQATPAHLQTPGDLTPKPIAVSKRWLIAFGVPALILSGVNAIWFAGMVNQWLIPWSSLKLLRIQ